MEGFLLRLDELGRVLGPAVAPDLGAAKAQLLEALAARDRGEKAASHLALARAIATIAAIGDRLDPDEGMLMRALAGAFVQGMAGEDREAMESALAAIQQRAGTPKPK
jgi:hypothetical protein